MSLGPPIRPDPAPKPEWTKVPDRPGFEVNAKGQFRYIPPPDKTPPAIWDAWLSNHSGEA